jgi:hypothetical protein
MPRTAMAKQAIACFECEASVVMIWGIFGIRKKIPRAIPRTTRIIPPKKSAGFFKGVPFLAFVADEYIGKLARRQLSQETVYIEEVTVR